MTFWEVYIVVVGFAEGGDSGFEVVVEKSKLFFVFTGLGSFEAEDKLLYLSNFKDTFWLVDLETSGSFYLPLSRFFTNVS